MIPPVKFVNANLRFFKPVLPMRPEEGRGTGVVDFCNHTVQMHDEGQNMLLERKEIQAKLFLLMQNLAVNRRTSRPFMRAV